MQIYLPILKWKQAERFALKDLKPEQKRNVNPVIQLVEKIRYKINPDGTRVAYLVPKREILKDAFDNINDLFDFSKIYLDPRPLFSLNTNEIVKGMSNAQTSLFGNHIVPVLHIEDFSVRYEEQALAFFAQQGVCLRVFREELDDISFEEIDIQLKKIGLIRNQVDFVIDYKITDEHCLDSLIAKIGTDVKIDEWRSIYFSSGSFRKNLVGLKPGNHDEIRSDWLLWKSLFNKTVKLRPLGFSDYTIQHPIYEPVNSPNTSYSVRYADKEKWIIMKGQARNAKNNADDLQYYAHALMLVNSDSFCGEKCCNGDTYILNLSKNSNQKRGNPATWLKVGINHHISLTLQQIENLH